MLHSGCSMWEATPNQTHTENTPQDLNNLAIAQIIENQNSDTLRIVFTGDSQRFYEGASDLVHRANQIPDVDFLILAGDLSDFGLLAEFEWVHEIFNDLYFPYIAVIGNHDLVSNGRGVFERMYGSVNTHFDFKGVRFILHDTNGREYGFNGTVPDLGYLRAAFQSTPEDHSIVPVCHVPPANSDFDPGITDEYLELMRSDPRVLAHLHGHNHRTGDGYPFGDGVRYINSSSPERGILLVLDILPDTVINTLVNY